MSDAKIYVALTLIPEVANEVTLGAEAMYYLLRFENLYTRSLGAHSGRCLSHRCFVTVFCLKLQFKFKIDNSLIWTPLYRVIVYFKGQIT